MEGDKAQKPFYVELRRLASDILRSQQNNVLVDGFAAPKNENRKKTIMLSCTHTSDSYCILGE